MISVSAGYGTDGSTTPMIVAERSLSRMVLPITAGSLASDVVQNRCVSTATPAAAGPSSRRVDQSAQHRPQPHHIEVRAADHAGADDTRLAETDEREVDRREIAERATAS